MVNILLPHVLVLVIEHLLSKEGIYGPLCPTFSTFPGPGPKQSFFSVLVRSGPENLAIGPLVLVRGSHIQGVSMPNEFKTNHFLFGRLEQNARNIPKHISAEAKSSIRSNRVLANIGKVKFLRKVIGL